jgi:hypothetical protein
VLRNAIAHATDHNANATANDAATTPVSAANWITDATVQSSTGGGCGWGTAVGDTRSGVLWRVKQTGDSVTLDEDMPNWPTDDIPYSEWFRISDHNTLRSY